MGKSIAPGLLAPATKSVASFLARYALKTAERNGIGPQEFQRLTGISAWEVQSAQARIPAHKHLAMMRLAQQLPFSPEFFELDMPTRWQVLPTLYAVVANAPSLVQGLGAYLHYRSLIGNVDTLTCHREGAQFEFGYLQDDPDNVALSAFGNFFLLLDIVRHYDPQGARACVLELTGQPFASVALLRREIGCEVRFGQERNFLRVAVPASDQPYAQHNPALHGFFLAQAGADLARLQPPDTFALRLQRFLATAIAAGDAIGPDNQLLAAACAHFQTSRWSLHRSLQLEDTHFQDVLGQVRAAEAQRLLLQPCAIAEISDLLGFASLSSFSRFFSGAFGMSPSQYRKNGGRLTISEPAATLG
ncbi:MAG: helix-turn-helix domain-containing protein [Rhodoferax sp.]|uniref:helix-turn-helix domain-containing protein n=1 Tax=Rhodoferax sp. TaxID=50421 RepID=UPI003266492D